MVNVQLNTGEWFDLGRVTSRKTITINNIKLRVVKTTLGEIVFSPKDK